MQVVYGLVGIKTHAKVLLVIRREGETLRRYVHLSTGNYNARTSPLYTDLDLLTCDPGFGDDAAQLMNLITGYSTATAQEAFEHDPARWRWKKLIVSPTGYHAWALRMIERETRHSREGRPAQIIAKMNSLVEPRVIDALLPRGRGGREDRPHRARHLLSRAAREHPRDLGHRPLPRALAHLPLPQRRGDGDLRHQRRLDAAQFLPPHRSDLADRSTPASASAWSCRSSAPLSPTTPRAGASSPTAPTAAARQHPARSAASRRFIEIARAEAVKIEPGVGRRRGKKKRGQG